MKRLSSILFIFTLIFSGGCQRALIKTPVVDDTIKASAAETQAKAEQKQKEEAKADQALMAELLKPKDKKNQQALKKYKEKTFDVVAKDLPVNAFFLSLVRGTGTNILLHPDVKGTITIDLKSVDLEQTLNAIRDVYGLQYVKRDYGYQILPEKLQTKIFHLNYLNVKRSGHSQTSVSSGELVKGDAETDSAGSSGASDSGEDLSTSKSSRVETTSETNFWTELENVVKIILGGKTDRQVVVNPQTGIVIVRGLPSELDEVSEFVKKAEDSLRRQVILEAKVLEITLNKAFETGVQWSVLSDYDNGAKSSAFGVGSESLRNTEEFGGIFGLNLQLNDFTGLIELLQKQGNVQVLSSPRISTVNNQKAVIKVGTDEFFVTELSSDTVGTGEDAQLAPAVTLTPFFSGIALDVTPQISGDDEIILHVHPTVSSVVDQTKSLNIGDSLYTLPLAFSSIRESDSIVKAKSNQIIVIGGLLKTDTVNQEATLPWLSRIPGLGALFTQKRDASSKTELVILLKPTVVGGKSWDNLLDEYADHSAQFVDVKSESFY